MLLSTAHWAKDGAEGEHFLDNLVRSMRAWGEERVSGDMYVVRDTPHGVLLVSATEDDSSSSSSSPAVYLALGLASRIGEMIANGPGLPSVVRITLLPFGRSLVYDGLIEVGDSTTHENTLH